MAKSKKQKNTHSSSGQTPRRRNTSRQTPVAKHTSTPFTGSKPIRRQPNQEKAQTSGKMQRVAAEGEKGSNAFEPRTSVSLGASPTKSPKTSSGTQSKTKNGTQAAQKQAKKKQSTAAHTSGAFKKQPQVTRRSTGASNSLGLAGKHAAPGYERSSASAKQATPKKASQVKHAKTATLKTSTDATGAMVATAGVSAKKKYYPALDGLRTLAVLSVMLYHLEVGWMQGGLLGVTVFFVLSGFLITGLLVQEWDTTNHISLKQFWLRRVRRLVPAIATVLVVTIVLTIIFNHQLLTKMRPDVLPSLGFVMNWWYIFHDVSYFEALGAPSPIQHFWSLAIEEQFYVVWPVILLGALKLDKRHTIIRRIVLVLAVVSALAMAVLYVPGSDPSRVYYGTDTRAFSLLIGAWLSMTSWGVSARSAHISDSEATARIALLNRTSIPALIVLVIFLIFVEDLSPILYYGGFVLVSVLTAILIATLVNEEALLTKIFSLPPLVWVGKRSYGMYLWHFPVTLLLLPWGEAHGGYTWWFDLLVIGVTIAVSALAFTFIEDPIRKGIIGKSIARITSSTLQPAEKPKVVRRFAIPTLVATSLIAISGVGLAVVPDENILPEEAIVSSGADADKATIDEEMLKKKAEAESKNASKAGEEQNSEGSEVITNVLPTDEKSRAAIAGNPFFEAPYLLVENNYIPHHTDNVYNPLIIADSVLGALTWTPFEQEFPYGKLDNYVGRNMDQSLAVYDEYLANDVVGQVVVYSVFSNHKLQPGKLDAIYEKTGKTRQLFLITPYVPQGWKQEVVQEMQTFAENHKGVHIIPWHTYVEQSNDGTWIYPDGIHLTPNGAAAMYNLIAQEIAPYISAKDYTLKQDAPAQQGSAEAA